MSSEHPSWGRTGTPSISAAQRKLGFVALAVCLGAMLLMVADHLGAMALPGCHPEAGCSHAAASRWGSLFGWPVSFLGLAWFTGLLVAWAFFSPDRISLAYLRLVRLGALVSVGFLVVMAVEQFSCVYCLAAHGAHLTFWLLLEWSRRRLVPGWPPALTVLVLFGCVSAVLYAVQAEQDRSVRARAETDARESIQKIAGTSRDGYLSREEREARDSISRIVAKTKEDKGRADETDDPIGTTRGSKGLKSLQRHYRLGPEQALVRVVLYFDYQCPHCRRVDLELQALFKRYPSQLSISVKHFPLCPLCNRYQETNTHPQACRAARAVEAAGLIKGAEGFWKMHNWLIERLGTFTDDELQATLREQGYTDPEAFLLMMNGSSTLARILKDTEDANKRKLMETPMIFINGEELRGWQAEKALERAVQAVAGPAPVGKSSAR